MLKGQESISKLKKEIGNLFLILTQPSLLWEVAWTVEKEEKTETRLEVFRAGKWQVGLWRDREERELRPFMFGPWVFLAGDSKELKKVSGEKEGGRL